MLSPQIHTARNGTELREVRTISMGFGGSAIGTRPDEPRAETNSANNPPDSLRMDTQID
jgi:hypothetical protein